MFDQDGNFVRKFGCYGKGPEQLCFPTGATFLNFDELLVVDALNGRIQQFNIQTGNFVRSFGKRGTGGGPIAIFINDEGNFIVVDYWSGRIQVLVKDGKFVITFGDNDPGKLNQPSGCIYHKNNLIVSNRGNHCLQCLTNQGSSCTRLEKKAKLMDSFHIHGVCVLRNMTIIRIFWCVTDNECIQQFTMEGQSIKSILLAELL